MVYPGDSEYDTAAPWLSLADQITKVSIGNEITYIGEEAFSGGGYRSFAYPNLETITFESKSRVTEIGNYAFAEANAVESITLPASLEKIGYESLPVRALEAVYVESGNKTFYTDNGVLYQGKNCLFIPRAKKTAVTQFLTAQRKLQTAPFPVMFIGAIVFLHPYRFLAVSRRFLIQCSFSAKT